LWLQEKLLASLESKLKRTRLQNCRCRLSAHDLHFGVHVNSVCIVF
jgi:hypothetical protein